MNMLVSTLRYWCNNHCNIITLNHPTQLNIQSTHHQHIYLNRARAAFTSGGGLLHGSNRTMVTYPFLSHAIKVSTEKHSVNVPTNTHSTLSISLVARTRLPGICVCSDGWRRCKVPQDPSDVRMPYQLQVLTYTWMGYACLLHFQILLWQRQRELTTLLYVPYVQITVKFYWNNSIKLTQILRSFLLLISA